MRNILVKLHCHSLLYAFILIFLTLAPPAKSLESILSSSQTISINQTLVSSKEIYELGFFPESNSENWYVGIWYKSIPVKTVVWVANRDNPVKSRSGGALKIGADGNIQILGSENSPVWSTNHTKSASNPVAELLDSGNFVLRDASDADPSNYLWQSFDFPTDTLLPGMKLGWDLKIGFERFITSWNNSGDPSSGEYTFRLEPRGFPEIFLWQGKEKEWRTGPWNGIRFSGFPEMKPLPYLSFIFEANQDEVYYSYNMNGTSTISRLVVTSSSPQFQRFIWINSSWYSYWSAPKDQCDNYRECGSSGFCDANASPVCKCLNGFVPKNPQSWSLRDGTDGCVRNVELDCATDGFSMMGNMKLPEATTAFVDEKMSLEDCRKACRKNCSCTAYSSRNITGRGSGCVMWTGELVDMRVYTEGGQDLYVRMPASLADSTQSNASRHHSSHKTQEIIGVVAVSAGVSLLLCGVVLCYLRRKKFLGALFIKSTRRDASQEHSQNYLINEAVVSGKRDYIDDGNRDELELPLYDFSTILSATYKFSDESKLGEGGFGCVYKGVLPDGQEVAVKRLSKTSGQGVEEFMNEVRLIARLQHRNLVRLLGCCVEKDEKMLIYEYLPHRSLDSILFTKERSSILNWQIRFDIICGIARGLLYLHQDSRFRIIHRDLKASNILLDGDLNPKISDFGMARIFGRDQTEANTRRVVGTYGYMAPEYAMDGLFSVKSDVFSFGVLVLEIISGKKNRGFYSADHELNLLAHSWNLWREQRELELLDPESGDAYSTNEVLRCMQVGLLCVQERAEDRPTMASVVLMLSSETATMVQPNQPGFSFRRNPVETDSSSGKQNVSCTVNHLTVTIIDGR